MSSSLRRGALAAAALAACAATLTACGAGSNAATLGVSPDSASKQVGDIKVQAVNIITTQNGEGPIGVSARIFNGGDSSQKLEAVRIKGVAGRVQLSPPEGRNSLSVPADGHLALGGEGHASATIPGAGKLSPGQMQRITFVFSETGKVSLRAAVVPADQDDYAKFGPSSVPSPSGIPTEDPSPRPSAPADSPSGSSPAGEETEPATGESSPESPAAGAEDGTSDENGSHTGH